jgi:alpha-tubulin suppressor-like RCC1 family protein
LGQLGDGTTTAAKKIPGWVLGPGNMVSVAANSNQSLGLGSDGTVWAWGYNGHGQLGENPNAISHRTTPVQVAGLSSVVAIAEGQDHSLALTQDGRVWAWGRNNYGQLGDGTTQNHYIPARISGLSGVTAIAAGFSHSLALAADGTVWAWGYNQWGSLGDGTNLTRYSPVRVLGLNTIVALAASESHSLALAADGTVWAWGANTNGELGNGSSAWSSLVPVKVSGLSGVTAITTGRSFSLALKADGTLWGWGDNVYGQLGDGTTTLRRLPVLSQRNIVSVGAGWYHSLAVDGNGQVWSWGRNTYGELGNGTSSHNPTPQPVQVLWPQ